VSTFKKGGRLHNNKGFARKDLNTNIEEYYIDGNKLGFSILKESERLYYINGNDRVCVLGSVLFCKEVNKEKLLNLLSNE